MKIRRGSVVLVRIYGFTDFAEVVAIRDIQKNPISWRTKYKTVAPAYGRTRYLVTFKGTDDEYTSVYTNAFNVVDIIRY